jgi:hypothetical protein
VAAGAACSPAGAEESEQPCNRAKTNNVEAKGSRDLVMADTEEGLKRS